MVERNNNLISKFVEILTWPIVGGAVGGLIVLSDDVGTNDARRSVVLRNFRHLGRRFEIVARLLKTTTKRHILIFIIFICINQL